LRFPFNISTLYCKARHLTVVVVLLSNCYLTPSEGWGRGGILQSPISWATSQGWDQRSKIQEAVSKMAHRRDPERRGFWLSQPQCIFYSPQGPSL